MRIDPTYGVLTRVALDAESPQLRRSRFYAILRDFFLLTYACPYGWAFLLWRQTPMLTQNDYQKALDALSACNSSGLMSSLSEVRDRIWLDVRANGGRTRDLNQHPIVVLYVCQLHQLAGLGISDTTAFCKAYDVVEAKIRETEPAIAQGELIA